MKRTTVIFLILCVAVIVEAQSNVGVGTTTPDPSAKVEISSTTQGFLMPRMTEAQRTAIISPANGLMVYQTNNADGTYYFDGTQWRNLSDNLGNHTATTTLNMDTNKIVNVPTPVAGLDAVNKDYVDAAIASGGGAGSGCCPLAQEMSNESATYYNVRNAFIYCDTLNEGGNSDWRLPATKEIIDAMAGDYAIPGTETSNYLWTRSLHDGAASAWRTIRLSDGATTYTGGQSNAYVRCVR